MRAAELARRFCRQREKAPTSAVNEYLRITSQSVLLELVTMIGAPSASLSRGVVGLARELARQHETQAELGVGSSADTASSSNKPLWRRLVECSRRRQGFRCISELRHRILNTKQAILTAHRQLLLWSRDADSAASTAFSASIDWLLDNFYMISDSIDETLDSMPDIFLLTLPKVQPNPGLSAIDSEDRVARVLEIACAVVSASSGVISKALLDLFLAEYQSVMPLTIGELWAFPIMVRIALISHIWVATRRTVDRLLVVENAEKTARNLINDTDKYLREFLLHPPRNQLTPAFVVRLLSALRATRSARGPITYVESLLKQEGIDPEDSARREAAEVANVNVMMQNAITSLRMLSRINWQQSFEALSRTDAILRDGDPARVYETMTFSTRNNYRFAVERIARRSNISEEAVAKRAVALAEAAMQKRQSEKSAAEAAAAAAAAAAAEAAAEAESSVAATADPQQNEGNADDGSAVADDAQDDEKGAPVQKLAIVRQRSRSVFDNEIGLGEAAAADADEVPRVEDDAELAKTQALTVLTAERDEHVGYYLIDPRGCRLLERICGYRPNWRDRFDAFIQNNAHGIFFSSITFFTLCFLALGLRFAVHPAWRDGCCEVGGWEDYLPRADVQVAGSTLLYLVAIFLAFFIANDMAISFVNQAVTRLHSPAILPRIELVSKSSFNSGARYEKHLPRELRTLIITPLLFSKPRDVADALEIMEVQYLSNKDEQMPFVLLSDFTDSRTETTPGDADVVKAIRNRLAELNARHPEHRGGFIILHRPRLFNPRQGDSGTWMGWERKRGKLEQLNALLMELASVDDSAPDAEAKVRRLIEEKKIWNVIEGNVSRLCGVRFVLTIDADTLLPRDSVKLLLGNLVHPLNRAHMDPVERRVVDGYGVLQPRVSTRLRSNCTKFAAIFSGKPGVDPYTTAVSDVFQDMFHEGSFTGKGIYDVAAFHNATTGRFKENEILSHDLIESSYVRSGLVTDVELYDDYPSSYLTWSKRKHRWIRGDWQLLKWSLLGLVELLVPSQRERMGMISVLSRWKIIDNLRRSFMEIVVFAAFAFAWCFAPVSESAGPLIRTTWAIIFYFYFPWLLNDFWALVRPPLSHKVSLRFYYHEVMKDAVFGLTQACVQFLFIPHQCMVNADAIVRTLYRLIITKRNLLEWTSFSHAQSLYGSISVLGYFAQMMDAIALLLVVFSAFLAHTWMSAAPLNVLLLGSGLAVAPLLLAWLFSPQIAFQLSNTNAMDDDTPSFDSQSARITAMRYALLHWRYFDDFVSQRTAHLAPDNFQETPRPEVAMRTSPTNIGMHLMSIVTARDLGILSSLECIEKMHLVFSTLDSMRRFRGHWFNWYGFDEKGNVTLLYPEYVSTVDSGNLCASLIACSSALKQMRDDRLLNRSRHIEAIKAGLHIVLRLLGATTATGRMIGLQATIGKSSSGTLASGASRDKDSSSSSFGGGGGSGGSAGGAGGGGLGVAGAGGSGAAAATTRSRAVPLVSSRESGPGPVRQSILMALETLDAYDELVAGEGCGVGGWARDKKKTAAATPAAAAQGPSQHDAHEASRLSVARDLVQQLSVQLNMCLDTLRDPREEKSRDQDSRQAKKSGDTSREICYWLKWCRGRVEEWLDPSKARLFDSSLEQLGAGSSSRAIGEALEKLEWIVQKAEQWSDEMDFTFLYDTAADLFRIGYNHSNHTLDPGTYDLLASEARIASYVAMAKGHAPSQHWMRLTRRLAPRCTVLVSWAGSMFEYLMPYIFLEHYPNTVLEMTHHGIVTENIEYTRRIFGHDTRVPWGMSESAYNGRNSNDHYQYRAFGVPTVALKRGQERDYVVAPYASFLAMMVKQQSALDNLVNLEHIGALGPYGFHDSVDYTRPDGYSEHSVVRNYMAHHVGMSMCSLGNVLMEGIWRKRFLAHPVASSAQLLLHERVPGSFDQAKVTAAKPSDQSLLIEPAERMQVASELWWRTFNEATPRPRAHLVGTVPCHVLVTNCGGGYFECDRVAITRWRNDAVQEVYGPFVYIRNLSTRKVWSAAHQPVTSSRPAHYTATFEVAHATFDRRDGDISTQMRLSVSSAHSAEVRLITITNHKQPSKDAAFRASSGKRNTTISAQGEILRRPSKASLKEEEEEEELVRMRDAARDSEEDSDMGDSDDDLSTGDDQIIEVCSYGEWVLQPQSSDRSHPAFQKLFVETEWLEDRVILARRRARSSKDQQLFGCHVVAVSDGALYGPENVQFETDRAAFIGRGRDVRTPKAMDFVEGMRQDALSGSVGAVLDPVFAIRVRVRVPPGRTVKLAFSTLFGRDRQQVVQNALYFAQLRAVMQTIRVSDSEMREELRVMDMAPERAMLYQEVFTRVLFKEASLGQPDQLVEAASSNQGGVPLLWSAGISGDLPIALCIIESERGLPCLTEMLNFHRYIRRKGYSIDLVVVNSQPPTYLLDLHDRIVSHVSVFSDSSFLDKPGGVFIRRKALMEDQRYRLLRGIARIVIQCDVEKVDWSWINAINAHESKMRPAPSPTPGDSERFEPERALQRLERSRSTSSSTPSLRRGRSGGESIGSFNIVGLASAAAGSGGGGGGGSSGGGGGGASLGSESVSSGAHASAFQRPAQRPRVTVTSASSNSSMSVDVERDFAAAISAAEAAAAGNSASAAAGATESGSASSATLEAPRFSALAELKQENPEVFSDLENMVMANSRTSTPSMGPPLQPQRPVSTPARVSRDVKDTKEAKADSSVQSVATPSIASRESSLGVIHPMRSVSGDMGDFTPSLDPSFALKFWNGCGGAGYDPLLRSVFYEMRINVAEDKLPPVPWSNVIANAKGGFLVTETGGGYTWAENSYLFRLTPWANDPVSDLSGEVIYLRDDATGEYWSATPQPCGAGEYTVRHYPIGQTLYHHRHKGIATTTIMSLSDDDGAKITLLYIKNIGDKPRALSVTPYIEWVLGEHHEQTQHQMWTSLKSFTNADSGELQTESHVLCAKRSYDPSFQNHTAYFFMTGRMTSFTCDRAEFLGRDGSLAKPRGLGVDMLKEATGAGFDPCAAMQQQILVAPGETARVAIVLGSVKSPNDAAARDDIEAIHRRLQSFSKCQKAVRIFTDTWRRREHAVTIKTPNSQLDELVNSWLLFQALSCRFWGRSALYQSGGALGFRDQLQDTLAFLHSEPALVRHHLLVCASRQFREGDVQHWWHFPSGRGVRTRISDDLAWLPFVVSAYVSATDDFGVLAEVVPYLDLKPLAPDQEDIYDLPQISDDRGTLFDHCLRALRRACTVGDSGLPLIGGGDWNDGMNRVGGENNRGQSVWMAWFLDVVLTQFAANVVAPLMADPPHDKAVAEVRSRLESLQRGGLNLAKEYRDLMDIADRYRAAAVTRAWDGDWFHRAYFADGTPLGSRNNRECQIDSIAQSWSAISLVNRAALGVDSQGAAGGLSAGGAARSPQSTADMSQLHRERSARAVDSAFERLVDRELGVVKLLTPPFDFETKFESKSGEVHRDPGYIRGYLPGVRENGAQYTHAAIWLAWACGIMGDGERAMNVLSLINPFNHSKTPEATAQYKVEPYVIAADVYTSQNHRGRGGWTWYTGSASWYYRTAVEVIMGVRKERGRWLIVDPCVPSTWAEFSITYRFSGTRYDIAVRNPDKVMRGVVSVTMDGQLLPDKRIPLESHTHSEEGRVTVHAVEVVMGKLPSGSG